MVARPLELGSGLGELRLDPLDPGLDLARVEGDEQSAAAHRVADLAVYTQRSPRDLRRDGDLLLGLDHTGGLVTVLERARVERQRLDRDGVAVDALAQDAVEALRLALSAGGDEEEDDRQKAGETADGRTDCWAAAHTGRVVRAESSASALGAPASAPRPY